MLAASFIVCSASPCLRQAVLCHHDWPPGSSWWPEPLLPPPLGLNCQRRKTPSRRPGAGLVLSLVDDSDRSPLLNATLSDAHTAVSPTQGHLAQS